MSRIDDKIFMAGFANTAKIVQFHVSGDTLYGLSDDGVVYSSYSGGSWKVYIGGIK